MSTKITTQTLSDMLAEKAGINKRTADAFVKAFVQTVIDGGISDGVVKIKGLGTFKTVKVADRESTNVNTGERFLIAGYTKLSFTPDVDIQSSATTETAPAESETSAPTIDSPAPVVETPKVEVPKVETPAPVAETPKVEDTKAETPAPVAETPKVEAPKAETPAPVVETPKVEAPKAETPAPVAETPKVEETKVETPAPVVETPKVEETKAETPAPVVETPKVEAPKEETPAPVVETPKVEAPKVETPAPVFDTDATKTYEKPDDGKPAPSALSQLYDIVKKYKKWLWLFAVIALAVIMLVILLSKNKNHEEPQQQTNPFTETVPATQSGPRIEPSAEEPATDENKRPRIHILQKGETLTTISVLYYHTPDSMGAIWKLNKFPDPNNIPLGTEIKLP